MRTTLALTLIVALMALLLYEVLQPATAIALTLLIVAKEMYHFHKEIGFYFGPPRYPQDY